MAGTIQLHVRMRVTNGNFNADFDPPQTNVTQTGQGMHRPVVNVGTTEEVLNFGDIGTEGIVAFRNLDDTNFVTIGPEDTGAMVPAIKIKPGEFQLFRLHPTVVLRAQADTAACLVEMMLLED